ncbi:unnamed protein product [Paramecium octaurelia]|uniref:Uncharacterized protein n=1 Tax=Paramecium octaurelia TaxID=43137 RepID=A0A8S1X6T3_PAROT|nr:unnamed protein product [Paramecium octaurelia]
MNLLCTITINFKSGLQQYSQQLQNQLKEVLISSLRISMANS